MLLLKPLRPLPPLLRLPKPSKLRLLEKAFQRDLPTGRVFLILLSAMLIPLTGMQKSIFLD